MYARKRLFFRDYKSPQACNQGAKPPLEKISPPQEKYVGRSLKYLPPSQKTFHPPRCPKLVMGLEVQQTFSFPFSLLRHYQMPECFYVNNYGF